MHMGAAHPRRRGQHAGPCCCRSYDVERQLALLLGTVGLVVGRGVLVAERRAWLVKRHPRPLSYSFCGFFWGEVVLRMTKGKASTVKMFVYKQVATKCTCKMLGVSHCVT